MSKIIATITTDQNWSVTTSFEGDLHLLTTLVWAMDIAKDFIKDQVRKDLTTNDIEKNSCNKNENLDNQFKEVWKTEAIWILLDAREKIEQRLQSVAKSDERVKLKIDKNLFEKL